jgi:hypothetical protein
MRMHGLSDSLPGLRATFARASSLPVHLPRFFASMPVLSPGFRLPRRRVLLPGLEICTGRAMPVQSQMPASAEAHISRQGSPGGRPPPRGHSPSRGDSPPLGCAQDERDE